jgi:hypothetical protein
LPNQNIHQSCALYGNSKTLSLTHDPSRPENQGSRPIASSA